MEAYIGKAEAFYGRRIKKNCAGLPRTSVKRGGCRKAYKEIESLVKYIINREK